ncbi:MAG: membrane protein insertion efficiency factor YidD [Candidatus Omnitrophota bacterium]
MSKIALFLIRIYQRISFLFPQRCLYSPTCSEYAKQAFLRYPFFKALKTALLRIGRCNPFFKGGFDPIK